MASIRETLLERGGKARSLDPDDVMETITEMLAEHPEMIEEFAPGMRLVSIPVSPTERVERMTSASIKRRQEEAEKRHARIVPLIKMIQEKKPDITLRQIAKVLDTKNIKPARSERWSAASVLAIMKKAGISESS